MKQRLLLSLLALVFSFAAMMPTTHAAFEPGSNWNALYTADGTTVYYNADSLQCDELSPDYNEVKVQICHVIPSQDRYAQMNYVFYKKDLKFGLSQITIYDDKTDKVRSELPSNEKLNKLLPNTTHFDIAKALFDRLDSILKK